MITWDNNYYFFVPSTFVPYPLYLRYFVLVIGVTVYTN